MSMEKIERRQTVSSLPSVLEVLSQLKKSGKAEYLRHTIRMGNESDGDVYIIEGSEIKYCEFRRVGLALVLVYLQRMLLQGL